MINNWCQFFRDIEKDPTAIVPPMTIGDMYKARAHVEGCPRCFSIMNRLADEAPDKPYGPTTTLN